VCVRAQSRSLESGTIKLLVRYWKQYVNIFADNYSAQQLRLSDEFRQGCVRRPLNRKVNIMLYTIAVVMLILWLFGMITSYTMGGFIHILLIIAIVVVLLRVING
jgi:hypothetical protein